MRNRRSATRKLFFFGAALLFTLTCILGGQTVKAAPAVGAGSYVLMEASTGRVLLCANPDSKLPMASTTKIMTCILAIECGDLNQVVQVNDSAVGVEGSSIYLQRGETLPLLDLVYGLMLSSGNDAAVAIAIHIGGSVEKFAELMNAKAKSIGAISTNFVTPNGLPDDNHYTTAYDLALISAYCMQNSTFREVVATSSKNLPADDDSPARYLRSKNKILYEYQGGNGVKTGYTKAAGKCLVSSAFQEDMQLIAVVLNDQDMFEDCKELLTYGFSQYDMVKLASAGESMGTINVEKGVEDIVNLKLSSDIFLPLSQEEYNMILRKICVIENIVAPLEENTVVGSLEIWLNGVHYGTAEVVTDGGVLENTYDFNLHKILRDFIDAA